MINKTKLVAFDMDGTLIQGRLIEVLSRKYQLSIKVKSIQTEKSLLGYQKTEIIANLLAGIRADDVIQSIDSIPLMLNAKKIVAWFKNNGYYTGIITDSYTIAAEVIAKKLELDFFAANELEVKDGIITGRISMPLGWEKNNCPCQISICKRYHLSFFANKFDVEIKDTIAIGDTRGDICMINHAGLGIAFMPKDNEILRHSKNIIRKPDLNEIMNYM